MKAQACRVSLTGLSWSIVSIKDNYGITVRVSQLSVRRKEEVCMDYINAFWVGGLICALAQILLDRTKLMPGRVMVLLVCTGAVLGALHIYQPLQDYAGAGASVPLAGFGNLLWKGVKEAVDKEGFIGIFLGGFKASAAGISAALVFGYLASLLCEPKMKK